MRRKPSLRAALNHMPEEFVLVPKEPTEAMILSAAYYLRTDSVTNIRAAWDAMLAAVEAANRETYTDVQ